MEPIRVLHILHSMNRGGAENAIMNYYRNIDRNKVQFDFLLTEPSKCQFEDEILSLGGRVFRVPLLTMKNPFPYLSGVWRFFRSHPGYRIVHSHTSSKSFFPLIIARLSGIPVRIAHCHGTGSKADNGLYTIIRTSLRKPLQLVATDYFACGIEAAKWLYGNRNFVSGKVRILPNVIECEKFSFNNNTRDIIREKHNIKGDTIVVGATARFSLIKNHPFSVDILASLLKRCPNFILLLVGDGPLRREIESMTQEKDLSHKVIITGLVPNVYEYLQAMDFFVMPSFYEGLPLSLVEAQVSGLKCFVSEGVPKEADITGLVSFLPLEKGPEYWAETIHKEVGYVRRSHIGDVRKAGYDAAESAVKLQEFYLNAVRQ